MQYSVGELLLSESFSAKTLGDLIGHTATKRSVQSQNKSKVLSPVRGEVIKNRPDFVCSVGKVGVKL